MGIVRYRGKDYEGDKVVIHGSHVDLFRGEYRLGGFNVGGYDDSRFKVTGDVDCYELSAMGAKYNILNGTIHVCRVRNTVYTMGNILGLSNPNTRFKTCDKSWFNRKLDSAKNYASNKPLKRPNIIKLSGRFKEIIVSITETSEDFLVELSGNVKLASIGGNLYMERGVIKNVSHCESIIGVTNKG